MKRKKIVWEKWDDPLKLELDEDTKEESNLEDIRKDRILITSLGAITVKDSSLASRHFDTWLANTNFDITEDIGKKIIKAEGVSLFLPVSRYSFVVGFPTTGLFDITECKKNLQDLLTMEENLPLEFNINDKLDDESLKQIKEKIDSLNNEGVLWCMYIMPNGKFDVVKSVIVNDEFIEKVNLFKNTHKLVGGCIYDNYT